MEIDVMEDIRKVVEDRKMIYSYNKSYYHDLADLIYYKHTGLNPYDEYVSSYVDEHIFVDSISREIIITLYPSYIVYFKAPSKIDICIYLYFKIKDGWNNNQMIAYLKETDYTDDELEKMINRIKLFNLE